VLGRCQIALAVHKELGGRMSEEQPNTETEFAPTPPRPWAVQIIPLRRACPFCLGNVRISVSFNSAMLEHEVYSTNEFCKLINLHLQGVDKLAQTIVAWDRGAL
jgi:hypothetical protein